jgi:hypothetical protein
MKMRCSGHAARLGRERNAYENVVGKPEGKRQLGRLRHRWDDTKMILRQRGSEDVDYTRLTQHRVQRRLLKHGIIELSGYIKGVEFLTS